MHSRLRGYSGRSDWREIGGEIGEAMGDEFGEALVNFLPLLRIPSRSDFIHTGFLRG